MDQYSSQSIKKECLAAELSSFSGATDDGTQKALDSLGKFKTSQALSQTKVRPYRSNASDNESPGLSSSHEKQEIKSRESSYHRTSTSQKTAAAAKTSQSQSYHSASGRHSDDRAARDGKISSQTPHHSSSAHLRGSSTNSTNKPTSNSKDAVSSNSRANRRLSQSPKKESSGERRSEMRDTVKERHQVDSSSKSQRNHEQSASTIQNERSENSSNAYKREQAELQKRIEELKKEISDQKSKFIEKSSHINEVTSKSEKNKEYISASSGSHRIATESSKPERKDDRASHTSLDYRHKASDVNSNKNDVAVKSDRSLEYFLAALSSHGPGAESSKHQNKDERVSHKSEDYQQREPQRHQRINNDRSRRSRSRSLGHRIEEGDRNIASQSARRLSHTRGDSAARSRSRNHEQSSKSRSHRSRSIERRSRRSRSHSTQSHRSGSRDKRASSKNDSLRDWSRNSKPYVKEEGEKARESSSLHSRPGQRSNSNAVG